MLKHIRSKFKYGMAVTITLAAAIAILCIGPLDVFTHGNYSDSVSPQNIDKEDFIGEIDLGEGKYTGEFIPEKRHFTGFELSLSNATKESTGRIRVSISTVEGRELGTEYIDICKIPEKSWYRVKFDVSLKMGRRYLYTISAEACNPAPYLQIVDPAYLGSENTGDNILIGYLYAEPTFSISEKVLFALLICGLWILCVGKLLFQGHRQKQWGKLAEFLFLLFVLSWNYMFNSLNNQNSEFASFQADSETLVTGAIYAKDEELSSYPYGMGRYTDLRGSNVNHNMKFLTDNNWLNGYSKINPQILLANVNLAKRAAAPGNYIQFKNGDVFQITKQEEKGTNLVVTLNTDRPLNYYKYGSLLQAEFYDQDRNLVRTEGISSYRSQFGLQGKVFKHFAQYIGEEHMLEGLNLFCSLMTAFVCSIIIVLIRKKYNSLMAGCFFFTFLLSPWIVNFARNLYWVEFTWFIPMAVGLFCSMHIQSKTCRLASYGMTIISIAGKCLCGYEYITVIMMSLIVFMLTDLASRLIVNDIRKDKGHIILLARTIVIIGCMAILGFVAAICIHARIRGDGNLIKGINDIIKNDVLRRTLGGNMNEFSASFWDSFQASSWQVLRTYFHFNTEVISGIAGNLFPMVCLTPLAIFIYNYRKKTIDWKDVVLYILSFLTSISWYVLGKQHSYIHTHMNYVLWYFGYIQICFYVICKQINRWIQKEEKCQE